MVAQQPREQSQIFNIRERPQLCFVHSRSELQLTVRLQEDDAGGKLEAQSLSPVSTVNENSVWHIKPVLTISASFALLSSIFCEPPAHVRSSSHRGRDTLEKRKLTTSGVGASGACLPDGSASGLDGVMVVVMIASAYLAKAPSATPARSQKASPRGSIHLSDGFSWNSNMMSKGFGETGLNDAGAVGLAAGGAFEGSSSGTPSS